MESALLSTDSARTILQYLKTKLADNDPEKLKALLSDLFFELINTEFAPDPSTNVEFNTDQTSNRPDTNGQTNGLYSFIYKEIQDNHLSSPLMDGQKNQFFVPPPNKPLIISAEILSLYESYLIGNERSQNTISKYNSDAADFMNFLAGESVSKHQCLAYKNYLLNQSYSVSTVNSKLCSLHSLLTFLNRSDCFVQLEKIQKKEMKATYTIITTEDYHKLLEQSSSPKKKKINLIIRILGQTGIRASELQFITVESLRQQEITIRNKNKNRKVPLIRELREMLSTYAQDKNIQSGPIFTDKNNVPLTRENIYNMIQRIAKKAGIDKRKAHPHAFRHFFAKSFYEKTGDLVMLSNILGHSDISTTRSYVTGTFEELCNEMEQIGMF